MGSKGKKAMRKSSSKTISRLIQAGLASLSALTLVLFGVLATGVLDVRPWRGLEAILPHGGGSAITLPASENPIGEGRASGTPDVSAPEAPSTGPGGSTTASRPSPDRNRNRPGEGSVVVAIRGLPDPESLPSDPDRANTDFEPPSIDEPSVVPNPPGPGKPKPPADDDPGTPDDDPGTPDDDPGTPDDDPGTPDDDTEDDSEGKPEGKGKPESKGKPEGKGKPDAPAKESEGKDKPGGKGEPDAPAKESDKSDDDKGKPEDTGKQKAGGDDEIESDGSDDAEDDPQDKEKPDDKAEPQPDPGSNGNGNGNGSPGNGDNGKGKP
jgi:hypothetical protein